MVIFQGGMGLLGVFEQPESGFGAFISGFVDRAAKQDEVSPTASYVEVGYGYKDDGLELQSRRERGLFHFVYSPLKVCSISRGLSV